jgi:hypothetical protein
MNKKVVLELLDKKYPPEIIEGLKKILAVLKNLLL